jgi:hypothetical protein
MAVNGFGIGQHNPIGNALAQINQDMQRERGEVRQNKLLDLQERRATAAENRAAATDARAQREFAMKTAPVVARLLDGVTDQPTYAAALDQARGLGLPLDGVPDVYDPAYVGQLKTTLGAFMDPKERFITASPGSHILDRNDPTKPVYEVPRAPDETLVEIHDPRSPTGTRMVPRAEAAGQPGKPPSSMLSITGYDEKGRPIIEVGGRSPGSGMANPTVNKIEGAIVDNSARMERLGTIAGQFKPEFLTFGAQITNWGRDIVERAQLPIEIDRKALREYTQFRAAAANDLNETLRQMSGAAITPQEADRLLKVIADAENDGPTVFKAKLDEVVRSVRLAQARLFHIRGSGLEAASFGGVSLKEMPAIIDARGEAIMRDLAAKNVTGEEARRQTKLQLATEFGMAR